MTTGDTWSFDPENQGAPDSDAQPDIPERIGAYRILQLLGKGGMGVVFLAEQTAPVKRKVALKLVHIGSDQGSLRARFQTERQAVALMNHPNIAAVYEAGDTQDGVPFLAMEYVEGETITDYCDRLRLENEERLALFLQVCDGIQHAHQKLVIHRDLKPSNILVAIQDGKPVPKIIDFGIAKGTGNPLVDQPGLTRSGAPVGTPMYMAPEQIEDQGGLDARVDVYALGVLLYEMLAGATPFGTMNKNAVLLMAKVVHEEPRRPSTRLTQLTETQTEVAHKRGTDFKSLRAQLKGDLDRIVMKALEKDRERRYGSVAELRADIQRYLDNDPVSVVPPSFLYRTGKFFKRHTLAVSAGLTVFLALILGLSGTTVNMLRAERARIKAEASEKKARSTVDYLQKILGSVDPHEDGRTVRVIDLLEKASKIIGTELREQPEIEASVRKTIGWTYLELGMYDEAERELAATCDLQKRILGEDHPETLNSINALGRLYYKKGRYKDAADIHQMVFDKEKELQGVRHPTTLWTMYNLAKALDKQGLWEQAEELYRLNLSIRTSVLGPDHPHTLVSINSLSLLLSHRGKLREAESLQRDNLENLKRQLGEDHPNTLNSMANLVEVLNLGGQYEEAAAWSQTTLARQQRVLGEHHPETLTTLGQWAWSLIRMGKAAEAERLDRETLPVRKRVLGENHPQTLDTIMRLGNALYLQGKFQDALPLLEKGPRQSRELFSEDHWKEAVYKGYYGRCLMKIGDLDKAQTLLLESFEALDNIPRIERKPILQALVEFHEMRGEPQAADRYRALSEF